MNGTRKVESSIGHTTTPAADIPTGGSSIRGKLTSEGRGAADPKVVGYVTGQQKYGEFMRKLRALLDVTLPGYVEEGKSYLTIGVGCTGGRHRSVVVADALASYFGKKGFPATVEHRDIDRD